MYNYWADIMYVLEMIINHIIWDVWAMYCSLIICLHSMILICMIISVAQKTVANNIWAWNVYMGIDIYRFTNSLPVWWIFMRINSIYVRDHYAVLSVRWSTIFRCCCWTVLLYWWCFIPMLIMMRGKFSSLANIYNDTIMSCRWKHLLGIKYFDHITYDFVVVRPCDWILS